MRGFDLLTAPGENAQRRTLSGGILTIAFLCFSVWLFAREYSNYQKMHVSRNMYVDQSSIDQPLVVHIDIMLPNAPCASLSIGRMDKLKHFKINIPTDLRRIDSFGNDLGLIEKEGIDGVLDDLKSKIGCQLKSTFQIDKVSGMWIIGEGEKAPLMEELKLSHPSDYNTYNLSFKLNELRFEIQDESTDKKREALLLKEVGLDKNLLENKIPHDMQSYPYIRADFWMELVSYSFKDYRTGYFFRSLQHSFNSNIRV